MRRGLMIWAVVVMAVGTVIVISSPLMGVCEIGIKASQLDSTPKECVDDVTIEIDTADGVRLKDGGISPAKIGTILGAWEDKDSRDYDLDKNINYQATSDGFVLFYNSGGSGNLFFFTGSVLSDVQAVTFDQLLLSRNPTIIRYQ